MSAEDMMRREVQEDCYRRRIKNRQADRSGCDYAFQDFRLCRDCPHYKDAK